MFGDLGKILKLVGEVKHKMPQLKEQLANARFTADAGGGVVTATVSGRMQLLGLKFSEQLLEDGDFSLDMLEKLVKSAVSAAQEEAATAAQEAMKELTGGMDLPGLSELM